MRASVLIPSYNRSALLREAVESVLRQTYADFEVVVVDDGSAEDAARSIPDDARVRCVRQSHGGISAARNRALKEARGELIAWLDDDDLYAPTKLEKQLAYLDAHPGCEIVFCECARFTDLRESELTPRQRRMLKSDLAPYRTYLASACFRRELYERWGGFNPDRAYMEDSEWVMRLGAGGVDLSHCLSERLYLRRVHDGQITFAHPPVTRAEGYAMIADALRGARGRGERSC